MNRSIRYLAEARQLMTDCVASRDLDLADHVGYMCLAFGARQIEHAESLQSLFPNRDCILVARSMIEGDSMLLWAATSEDRALRWREFMHVENWRLYLKKRDAGTVVPKEDADRIQREIERVGASFLTTKAERARDRGQPLPADPYVRRWHDRAGYSMKAECEALDVAGLYNAVYNRMSDWHHWGSLSIGQVLWARDGNVGYAASDGRDAEWAISGGIMAVAHTAAILDLHFELGKTDAIRALVERYYEGKTHNG